MFVFFILRKDIDSIFTHFIDLNGSPKFLSDFLKVTELITGGVWM